MPGAEDAGGGAGAKSAAASAPHAPNGPAGGALPDGHDAGKTGAAASGAGGPPHDRDGTDRTNPDPNRPGDAGKVPVPGDDTGRRGIKFYKDVRYVEDGDYPRIDFERTSGTPALPVALREFKRQISEVARVLRVLFQNDTCRRGKFFDQLRTVAYTGACVPYTNMDVGLDNLAELKGYIADQFPAVRNQLWKWNLGLVLSALAFIIVGMTCNRVSSNGVWFPAYSSTPSHAVRAVYAIFLIPMGVMLGIFTEFVFRVGDDMTYEQLAVINPGRWKPLQRAINTVIIAGIFAAILAGDGIRVGVGNTLLNQFWGEHPELSVVVGFVTGFAYPYVRDVIQQFRPVKRDKGP